MFAALCSYQGVDDRVRIPLLASDVRLVGHQYDAELLEVDKEQQRVRERALALPHRTWTFAICFLLEIPLSEFPFQMKSFDK